MCACVHPYLRPSLKCQVIKLQSTVGVNHSPCPFKSALYLLSLTSLDTVPLHHLVPLQMHPGSSTRMPSTSSTPTLPSGMTLRFSAAGYGVIFSQFILLRSKSSSSAKSEWYPNTNHYMKFIVYT